MPSTELLTGFCMLARCCVTEVLLDIRFTLDGLDAREFLGCLTIAAKSAESVLISSLALPFMTSLLLQEKKRLRGCWPKLSVDTL